MRESGKPQKQELPRVRTGVAGLDKILGGGLPRDRIYLLEGAPGTGKTTLAQQFLLEGVRESEKTLYVTLSETKDELLAVANSHGWSLDGIHLYELEAMEDLLKPEDQYTVFHPAEVELGQTTKRICEQVEAIGPARVVLDSLSEMRLIAQNPLRYRRQILSLKQFFTGRQCTVLLLDDGGGGKDDLQLESIAHGVILLEQQSGEYGLARRRLQVRKMRGVGFREGYHDFSIKPGGLVVYPRLLATQDRGPGKREMLTSGVAELDLLTGGGLDLGSSTLILGPSGSGKSMIATQYALAALKRGERVSCYLFEDSVETFLHRGKTLGMDLNGYFNDGRVETNRIDPAELSPGEFTSHVRRSVEERQARVVVIDSVNGYLYAMPNDRVLVIQMHELLTYLSQRGILTILVLVQHGLMSATAQSPVDLSYLADTVMMLRYFEAGGSVRQALSVIKKRTGTHERTIRELTVGSKGLKIGEPLREFIGVLTGAAQYRGSEPLLEVGKE